MTVVRSDSSLERISKDDLDRPSTCERLRDWARSLQSYWLDLRQTEADNCALLCLSSKTPTAAEQASQISPEILRASTRVGDNSFNGAEPKFSKSASVRSEQGPLAKLFGKANSFVNGKEGWWGGMCRQWQVRDLEVQYSALDIFEAQAIDENDSQSMVRALSRFALFAGHLNTLIATWTVFFTTFLAAYGSLDDGTTFDFLQSPELQVLLYVDIVMDIFYFLGGPLTRLRTTQLDYKVGTEEFDPARVRANTIRSAIFWCDLLSCMPLVLLLLVGFPTPVVLLKAIRLWRILSKPKHVKLPIRAWSWTQISRLLLLILTLGHLTGIAWFLTVYGAGTWKEHIRQAAAKASLFEIYSLSLQHGMIMFLGRMNSPGKSGHENLLFAIIAPIGILAQAMIFGRIAMMIQHREAMQTQQQEQITKVRQAIDRLQLPLSLQVRVLSYFTYQRMHGNEETLNTLFGDLSRQLRWELLLYLYRDLVLPADFLREAHPNVLQEIILALSDESYMPGDYVCRYNDEGDGMYFLARGSCAVLSATFVNLTVLYRGSYFGEISLLTGSQRTAYVRADNFSSLAFLSKDKFDPILEDNPEQITLMVGHFWESVRAWYVKSAMNGKPMATHSKVTAWVHMELEKRIRDEYQQQQYQEQESNSPREEGDMVRFSSAECLHIPENIPEDASFRGSQTPDESTEQMIEEEFGKRRSRDSCHSHSSQRYAAGPDVPEAEEEVDLQDEPAHGTNPSSTRTHNHRAESPTTPSSADPSVDQLKFCSEHSADPAVDQLKVRSQHSADPSVDQLKFRSEHSAAPSVDTLKFHSQHSADHSEVPSVDQLVDLVADQTFAKVGSAEPTSSSQSVKCSKRLSKEGGSQELFGRRLSQGGSQESSGRRLSQGGSQESFGRRLSQGGSQESFGRRLSQGGAQESFGKRLSQARVYQFEEEPFERIKSAQEGNPTAPTPELSWGRAQSLQEGRPSHQAPRRMSGDMTKPRLSAQPRRASHSQAMPGPGPQEGRVVPDAASREALQAVAESLHRRLDFIGKKLEDQWTQRANEIESRVESIETNLKESMSDIQDSLQDFLRAQIHNASLNTGGGSPSKLMQKLQDKEKTMDQRFSAPGVMCREATDNNSPTGSRRGSMAAPGSRRGSISSILQLLQSRQGSVVHSRRNSMASNASGLHPEAQGSRKKSVTVDLDEKPNPQPQGRRNSLSVKDALTHGGSRRGSQSRTVPDLGSVNRRPSLHSSMARHASGTSIDNDNDFFTL